MNQALTSFELKQADFRKIRSLVYQHCGINLHEGKMELVRARLSKRLRLGNFKSFREYMNFVQNEDSGTELTSLIDTISTNLTSFYREKQHFKFLEEQFLPSLLQLNSKIGKYKIRCWSAGCSTGEEPYTIALTLLKSTENMGRWDIRVLATDISTAVLEKAKKGLYPKERIQPVPGNMRIKYFIPRETKTQMVFEVNHTLKNLVLFRYLNLMQQWPIKTQLDFIFCRNVMIYFDKPTQQKLVNRFWEKLRPGGILFTGHSESLNGIDHKFKYVQPTIYMK